MGNAKRDDNYVPTLIAVSNADGITPVTLYADPTTHRLLVSATQTMSGSLDDLSDVVITSAAQGDILYHNGTNWVNLAAGATGKFLKTQGAGANPTWDTPTAGAAGSDTHVQFNDGGSALGGDAGFTYNKTTDAVSANGGFLPITNDTGALGSATKSFADLFLASGAVINFANGDVVLTHSTGILTLTTGTLALGANNLTMTGSIAATANRVTKGWFTDLEITNVPTIGGNALGTIYAAIAQTFYIGTTQVAINRTSAGLTLAGITLTTPDIGTPSAGTLTNCTGLPIAGLTASTVTALGVGSIELGHASDTTITRTGAGAIAVEGVAVLLSGGALGTPSGGTLTNCTGLPIAGLTASTSTALGVGSIELGHASDTTIARVSAGVVSIEGVNVVTVSATQTLTNKSIGAGALTLEENASIALDPAGSADGKYSGITIAGTAGATLAFGDLVYLDPTDSRWELADANAAAAADGDSRGILGICVLAAAGDGSATTILLNGVVRADTAFPALTINAPVYVSETAGDIVVTQPTTTDVVIRVVGFALTADEIYFNPSADYITHT